VKILETAVSFAIEWTASYRLGSESFIVTDAVGERVIYGYPVQELARATRRAKR
jgi:hypothetical protein